MESNNKKIYEEKIKLLELKRAGYYQFLRDKNDLEIIDSINIIDQEINKLLRIICEHPAYIVCDELGKRNCVKCGIDISHQVEMKPVIFVNKDVDILRITEDYDDLIKADVTLSDINEILNNKYGMKKIKG